MSSKHQRPVPILFFAISAIVVIVAISICSLVWMSYKREQVKDLHYTSSIIKRYYELSFNQWRNTLLNLGERLMAIEGEKQDSIRLAVVNSSIKNYSELLAFGLTAPDGHIMTFSNSEPGDSLPNLMESENSRRSFMKAREAEILSIGESYYFDNVLDWILPLRVPIRDDEGKLIAVNTTALQYKVLRNELRGFGFDPNYRVHFVNDDFNVVQFYYPLVQGDYDQIIRKDANIYNDTTQSNLDEYNYFVGLNRFEGFEAIVVEAELEGLNHTLYVSVDKKFLYQRLYKLIVIIFGIAVVIIALLWYFFRVNQKKQEQYLSILIESEANLKSIFESTSNIIGLFDKNKKLMEFNQSFANYALQTDGIVLSKGMDVISLMKNRVIASVFTEFQNRALRGEKFTETVEYPSPNGNIYFSLTYNPISQNGEITGLSMFVQDITELKNYQKQLEEQAGNLETLVKSRTSELEDKNKELEVTLSDLKAAQQKLIQAEKMASLGILSAGIGHEINNPLNFIKNGASAIQLSIEDNPKPDINELKPLFDIINDGVERANKIVKSLSHFSRTVKRTDEECDLVDVIDHCLTILQNQFKGKVEVVKEFTPNCPKIIGNEGKLHQAVLNLLTNAEQSIEDKGQVVIRLNHNTKHVFLEIEDNGCGISEENLDKIADPFFTTKDPGVGTGLGLFITFSIIEEHNGQVNVNSNENNGTIVTLTFDL